MKAVGEPDAGNLPVRFRGPRNMYGQPMQVWYWKLPACPVSYRHRVTGNTDPVAAWMRNAKAEEGEPLPWCFSGSM